MDISQGCSFFRHLRFCAAEFGDDDLAEQVFGVPAFEDHFFGEVNCGTGGKVGDGCHDY